MNKEVKRKFVLLLAVVALVVYFGGQLYLVQNAPPENKARLTSWVRESPAWQFYGFMGLVSIPMLLGGWIMLKQKKWSRIATSGSIQNAKKMALSLWYVEGEPMMRGGDHPWVVVKFRHMSFGQWKVMLPVRPGHPDIDKFRRLRNGETVEFEALSEGMECALEHELCGFLRIKSIS